MKKKFNINDVDLYRSIFITKVSLFIKKINNTALSLINMLYLEFQIVEVKLYFWTHILKLSSNINVLVILIQFPYSFINRK